VGVTRAEERLILTSAAHRTIRGLRERTVASPFLAEMPADSLAVTDHTGMDFDDDGYESQRAENAAINARFRRGQIVRHARFGVGRIRELTNLGSQTRAIVDFNKHGEKVLILQYAQLEVVE
jgi:DNA helicase-2/ATP-dependent DNA helicase PcrA